MAENKTKETGVAVEEFIAQVEHNTRREDAIVLDELFRRVTGWTPRMWGPTIIGYGSYDYTYESGRTGTSLATGFSPRKANMVLYIMPGYQELGEMLARVGKHKIGKACLYLGPLKNNDLDVIEEIIRAGLDDLGTRWPVHPS